MNNNTSLLLLLSVGKEGGEFNLPPSCTLYSRFPLYFCWLPPLCTILIGKYCEMLSKFPLFVPLPAMFPVPSNRPPFHVPALSPRLPSPFILYGSVTASSYLTSQSGLLVKSLVHQTFYWCNQIEFLLLGCFLRQVINEKLETKFSLQRNFN